MECIVIVDFYDDDTFFQPLGQWMGPIVDYVFTHVPSLVDKYEEIGIRCKLTACVPMNPSLLCRSAIPTKLYDASFVGTLHHYRKKCLAELNKLGTPIHYLGGGYDAVKLPFAQLIEYFHLTRINMNFSAGLPGKSIIVGRVFEVTLCGGFLLTEHFSDIENWFEPDKEIVCFKSTAEASGKIRYYLKHPAELERIASRGYERALNYSGPTILRRVFSEIETEVNQGRIYSINHDLSNSTPLHAYSADQYYTWLKAILRCDLPLRNEWRETLQLVLKTNPGHMPAQKMLKKSEKWGDPEPLRGVFIYFKYHFNKNVTIILRFIRRVFKKLYRMWMAYKFDQRI